MGNNDYLKLRELYHSNMYNNPKKEIYHYGVPGMRWGVRRYEDLSDDELRSRIARVKLEDEYAEIEGRPDREEAEAAEKARKAAEEATKKASEEEKAMMDSLKSIPNAIAGLKKNLPEGEYIKEYAKYPDLTNDELNNYVRRIELERKLSDLSGATKGTPSKEKKLQNFLTKATIASLLATSAVAVINAVKTAAKNAASDAARGAGS